MQETRRQRLQAVILEELSMVVPREVKDPRVPSITFTNVEVTPDGSQATVYVSMLGASQVNTDDPVATKAAQQKMKECIEGLQSASGFLRRHIAKVLTVRHIPTLIFKEDRGFENTIRVHDLLKKISSENENK
jgi:ribosome-binding factor A